jgi:LCP family protein required for cell wall assembly
MHPGVLGKSSNEGADAIKEAVEGTLGIPVEYYVLVNLEGFKEIVDAMGGVTVNINEEVAIGGNTDAGIPPDDYLQPGPDQHLNGFQALWFARGRWGSDDYERMERQRCMVDAIIDAADPANLLLRYLDLLQAGEEIVYTDIPQELASAFVDLALRVKDAKVKSVVFRSSEEFSSADPDFEWMRETVAKAIHPPPKRSTTPGEKRNPADDPKDACAYNPTGEIIDAAE